MSTIMKIWPIIGLPLFALSSSYELHYSASEFAFDTCNGYDRVESNYTLSGEPGAPELPADCRHYIIPLYASAASLMINESTITQMPDSFLIYPAQLMVPVGESGPWVPPDTLIYDSDSLFPEEFIRVVGEGQLDGARIITVEVRPLLYRPKSQRLYLVEDIEFEFVFDSVGTPALLPQIRGEYEQEVYDAFINDLVENTVEVQSYYQKPSIVQNSQ